jgi:hypothetical protein
MIVSVCTDFKKLQESGLLRKWLDADGEHVTKLRSKVDGSGGVRVCHNGNMAMVVLSDADGLEELAALDYITVTSYEAIFGYSRQVEKDGVLQYGPDLIVEEPATTRQIVIGHTDDLTKPIYHVDRIETPTTRIVTDEDGNEIEVLGRPLIEYVTTEEIEGYHSKELYGDIAVPAQTYTYPNPIMEDVLPDPEMRALYDLVYPQTPQVLTGDDGPYTYTPAPLFSVPAGHPFDHINVG